MANGVPNARVVLVNEAGVPYGNSAPLPTGLPSGFTGTATFTPSASAYGAGDIIDVAKEVPLTFSNGVAIPSGSLIRVLTTVLKIDQTGLQASEAGYIAHLYSATPPSAQADNALWTLASGDLTTYRGSIALGTPADIGNACFVKTPLIDTDIKLTGTSLFAELVTTPAFTPGAVARQVFFYGVVL